MRVALKFCRNASILSMGSIVSFADDCVEQDFLHLDGFDGTWTVSNR
jgi:hypothetical protein